MKPLLVLRRLCGHGGRGGLYALRRLILLEQQRHPGEGECPQRLFHSSRAATAKIKKTHLRDQKRSKADSESGPGFAGKRWSLMTMSRRPPTGMASAHDVFGAGHSRCTYRGASRRSFGRHAPTARAIFFAALFSFSTAPAAGMRGTKKLTVDQGKFREWYRFCFDRGDVEISTPSKKGSVEGVDVMLCKRREYLDLLQQRGRTCDYFRADDNTCEKFDLSTKITKEELNGYYIFLVGMCNDEPSSAEIDVRFSFVNHDKNHLSCELTLFPALYLGVCFAWLVATTLWAAHWLVQPQHSVFIHKIMTAVPAVQVLRVVACDHVLCSSPALRSLHCRAHARCPTPRSEMAAEAVCASRCFVQPSTT